MAVESMFESTQTNRTKLRAILYELEIDPAEAELVREGVKRVLAGETANAIPHDWTRRGIPGALGGALDNIQVTRTLASPHPTSPVYELTTASSCGATGPRPSRTGRSGRRCEPRSSGRHECRDHGPTCYRACCTASAARGCVDTDARASASTNAGRSTVAAVVRAARPTRSRMPSETRS